MRKMNSVMVGLVLSCMATTRGAITIEVGDHELQPNMSSQTIQIPVTGSDSVQGLNLLVQLGDGGAALGGVDGSAPAITEVETTSGTIFAGNNTGNNVISSSNQFWEVSTTTSSGSVTASGILAVLQIDTTGFSAGQFDLKLADVSGFDTDFAPVVADITNGTVTVIPEPAAPAILAVGWLLLRNRKSNLPQA